MIGYVIHFTALSLKGAAFRPLFPYWFHRELIVENRLFDLWIDSFLEKKSGGARLAKTDCSENLSIIEGEALYFIGIWVFF